MPASSAGISSIRPKALSRFRSSSTHTKGSEESFSCAATVLRSPSGSTQYVPGGAALARIAGGPARAAATKSEPPGGRYAAR